MNGSVGSGVLATRVRHRLLAAVGLAALLASTLVFTAPAFALSIGTYDQWDNVAPAWNGGASVLNTQRSAYREGEAVPMRLVLTDLDAGPHTVRINYHRIKTTTHSYDYLTTFPAAQEPAAAAAICTGWTTICGAADLGSASAPSTTSILNNAALTTIAGATTGDMWLWGGTLTATTAPVVVAAGGGTQATIDVSFTVPADDSAILLAWGSHLASEADWGAGNGASSVSGAPFHVRIDELDGASVGNRSLNIMPGAIIPPGSVTIIKDADPAGDQQFEFDPSTGSNVFLVDDGDPDTATDREVFPVTAGQTLSVDEVNIPDGWTLTGIACQADASTVTIGDDGDFDDGDIGVSITMATGDAVICTFTNTEDPPDPSSITIEKVTSPVSDAQDFAFTTTGDTLNDFSLDTDSDDDTLPASTQFSQLQAGTYTVTETATTGWTLTGLTCTGGADTSTNGATATINLAAGEDVTCTFTNTEDIVPPPPPPPPPPVLTPGIGLDKTAAPTLVRDGDTVTYTYVVTNTGQTTLTQIALVDDILGTVSLTTTSLAPGASTTAVIAATSDHADEVAGAITNTAVVTGTSPTGAQVTAQDAATVDVIHPAIEVDKTPDVTSASPGDVITYTYVVTNTGDVTLTGVAALDDLLGAVTLTTDILLPGESTTATLTHTVVEADLPGPIVNVAAVAGRPVIGPLVTDTDDAQVSLQGAPAISLTKDAIVTADAEGLKLVAFEPNDGDDETITYAYVVTNDGDVTLTDVSVVDDVLGPVTLAATTLAPGDSTTGTATHVLTADDAATGSVVNVGTATGVAPDSTVVEATDDEEVFVTTVLPLVLDRPDEPAPAPAPEPAPLPVTGFDGWRTGALGSWMIALGALLLTTTDRRRRGGASPAHARGVRL